MMEDKSDDKTKEAPPTNEAMESRQKEEPEQEAKSGGGGGGGGWGGWGSFSPFTVLSDLQKAAEEISRNAAEAAEKAAKSIADINLAEDSESSKGEEDDRAEGASDKETDDESAELRKSALDKLGNAGEDSILGQGLKVLDHSVENFATGAWQALGNAWKGGSGFVQRLENSAVDLAETIQKDGIQGAAGSVAPLLESGKAFTTKGIQVLEYVGKETMDLLIAESGMDVDKNSKSSEKEGDDDQLLEDVTFDRCFYIYGGPEQLEELESLANHYALLFNRRKVKLSSEQKSAYDGKLKMVQQVFDLNIEMDGIGTESNKGKNVEAETKGGSDEIKSLHDASVGKAADMAAGFTNALAGQTVNDMVQRTSGRLETLHSEGIHFEKSNMSMQRLSEMACAAVSQLLMLGKSIISHANKTKEDADDDIIWPEEIVERAKLIRKQTQTMARYTEAVSKSFVTGISDVAEAYLAAVKGATTAEDRPKKSIQEKADTFTELLQTGQTAAVWKIQDGLQYLTYVVISTSMPAA